MLFIKDLIPTHNKLRNIETFNYFYNRFRTWKPQYYFNRPDKILIFETEDNKKYIWNAHHMLAAAKASHMIEFIPEDYYTINHITYSYVESINFDVGFVTPFDLKNECRLPDFSEFKNNILTSHKSCKVPTPVLIEEIYKKSSDYKEKRQVWSIDNMLELSGL